MSLFRRKLMSLKTNCYFEGTLEINDTNSYVHKTDGKVTDRGISFGIKGTGKCKVTIFYTSTFGNMTATFYVCKDLITNLDNLDYHRIIVTLYDETDDGDFNQEANTQIYFNPLTLEEGVNTKPISFPRYYHLIVTSPNPIEFVVTSITEESTDGKGVVTVTNYYNNQLYSIQKKVGNITIPEKWWYNVSQE